jgi:hypothetical protein
MMGRDSLKFEARNCSTDGTDKMCRSIHRLRDGRTIDDADAMTEAARHYVRRVSGFSKPAVHNQQVFDRAVEEVASATQRLMDELVIR